MGGEGRGGEGREREGEMEMMSATLLTMHRLMLQRQDRLMIHKIIDTERTGEAEG